MTPTNVKKDSVLMNVFPAFLSFDIAAVQVLSLSIHKDCSSKEITMSLRLSVGDEDGLHQSSVMSCLKLAW